MIQHLLVAFDFDHTVIEENSDVVARKLISADLISEEVRNLHKTKGWTDYMSEIFKLLHKNNVTKETILGAMDNLTSTPNMLELFEWLKSAGHENIIISDSNSVFIAQFLQFRKLNDCVKQVFTNPASFGEDGLLSIQPYHHQEHCQLSTVNLCKGDILESYIKQRQDEGVKFDAVAYVGDGHNDICPSLLLSANDFVFPRAGFTLDNEIRNATMEQKVVAQVYPWTSATDILNVLRNL